MSGTYAAQWGHLLAVARLTVGTARIEGAPRWWVDHIGWHTGNRVQPFLAYLVEAGHRLQEAERVRVARVGVKLYRGGMLGYAPTVHDDYPVAQARNDAQVVGNKDN